MLTDDEIKNIWNECPQDRFPVPEFARAIERAVMAKAAEQEPVLYQIKMGVRHVACFAQKDYAQQCADEENKRNSLSGSWVDYTVSPLYAHPLPAQAIPEITDEMRDAGGEALYGVSRERAIEIAKEDKFDSHVDQAVRAFEAMISASPKP